jgi:hypothetical protein
VSLEVLTAVTRNGTVSVTCGADSRYQRLRALLPSVFRVEGRMVNYVVMAVEQKICSNTVLLPGIMLLNSVHASTKAHACTYASQ